MLDTWWIYMFFLLIFFFGEQKRGWIHFSVLSEGINKNIISSGESMISALKHTNTQIHTFPPSVKLAPIDEGNRWQNLRWWVYTLKVILQFPALNIYFVLIYRRLWCHTHSVCVWSKKVEHDSFITQTVTPHWYCVAQIVKLLIWLFHPFPTCWFPIYSSWWCETLHSALRLPQAPEGSSVMWQQQDRHVWLQGAQPGGCLATDLQYCYVTEARHHNNSKHPFIVSSHTTDAKTEEKPRSLLLLFQWKCLIN